MEIGCVRFVQILFAAIALMELLASQGNLLLGTAAGAAVVTEEMPRARSTGYNLRVPDDQDYFGNEIWKNHHRGRGDMVVGEFRKLFAQRSGDDQKATSRRRLQQTSTSAEVQVLMAFKELVTSDSLGALSSWTPNDSDACHWKGVRCPKQFKSIMALELSSLQLVGTISPLLGRLVNLQTLDLSDNSFNGEIPTSLFNCSNLSYLALRNNSLTGKIPSQVGDLLYLQFLDLGQNLLLAGLIPSSLSNCSLLGLIHLDNTTVGGEIPSSLGQLGLLESLNLGNTYNSGTIPKSLGNCSYLTSLVMGNMYDLDYATTNSNALETELSGELPIELANLKQLNTLEIAGTSIQGGFPAWIVNLTALTSISFVFNSFTGEIPAFLGKLPVEEIDLGVSGFSGAIPAAISNCSNLRYLGLDSAPNVTGPIPPELGMLSKLETLLLNGNGLTGTIPLSLSNCSALTVLWLGDNPLLDPQPLPSWLGSLVNLSELYLEAMNLHGEIPMALGALSKLDHLGLWGNQLSGAIPASLGNCTSLVYLELTKNELSGEVPSEIWMSQLQNFQIDHNSLTGTLPASIGNLSLLQRFRCDNNSFTGGIPSQLGSHQSLEKLHFGNNNFNGFIPQSLGNCSALFYLDMSGNQLSGSIPSSLGNLTALGRLSLATNLLEGEIPFDLMKCTALGYLDLSHNLLGGTIPQEIGELVSLQDLFLNNNKLSGALPASLGYFSSLSYLDASYNAFYGTIPGKAIANISAILNSLNVSHNNLSGSLPQELGKLTLVYYLDFSSNNFSGSIPSDLGDCKSIQRLDISVNSLSGGIPAALAQLQYLTFVNVSYNHLQGPVPEGGFFNSSNLNAASFLGNPELCGSMLKDCPGPSPARASSCKFVRCGSLRTAIIVACAVVGVVFISVVLICWLLYYHGKNDVQVTFVTCHGLEVSEQELLSIIERPENVIGVGGTSTVYKGVLNGGSIVAIKVMSLLNDYDDHEHHQLAATQFYKEALTLSQLRHRNILKVLGLFSTQNFKALILEYMPRASLHEQLYHREKCELNWQARLNIALGVAHGMVYLHSQAHVPVVHRDLKPSNIFLSAELEPKLGDFGISRFVNPDRAEHGEVTATKFCGTFGYIPPEYGATTKVSTKGDVYSYGVILLELLTRKRPIVTEADSQWSTHLVDWVLESFEETPLAVLDPMLLISESISTSSCDENNSSEQMKLLMRVGLLCTQDDPQSRPRMNDVMAMLMQIKERGSDPAHHPTLAELADEITDWGTPSVTAAVQTQVSIDHFSD